MIYFVHNPLTNNVKIGRTSNKMKTRLSQLNTGNDVRLTIIRVIDVQDHIENAIFGKFEKYRLLGEWFSYNNDLQRLIENIPNNNTKKSSRFCN